MMADTPSSGLESFFLLLESDQKTKMKLSAKFKKFGTADSEPS